MAKQDYLIKKWKFLLQGLSEKKSVQYKFAKIYEKSSLMNSFEDFKLIVAILYRTFKRLDTLYLSNSKKNHIEIRRIEEYSLFDYDKILIDFFESFTDRCADTIIEKIGTGEVEKIGFLKINHENEFIIVELVY